MMSVDLTGLGASVTLFFFWYVSLHSLSGFSCELLHWLECFTFKRDQIDGYLQD